MTGYKSIFLKLIISSISILLVIKISHYASKIISSGNLQEIVFQPIIKMKALSNTTKENDKNCTFKIENISAEQFLNLSPQKCNITQDTEISYKAKPCKEEALKFYKKYLDHCASSATKVKLGSKISTLCPCFPNTLKGNKNITLEKNIAEPRKMTLKGQKITLFLRSRLHLTAVMASVTPSFRHSITLSLCHSVQISCVRD